MYDSGQMDYDGDQGMGGGMHFDANDIFSAFFAGGMGNMGGFSSGGRSSKGGQSFTFRFGWIWYKYYKSIVIFILNNNLKVIT